VCPKITGFGVVVALLLCVVLRLWWGWDIESKSDERTFVAAGADVLESIRRANVVDQAQLCFGPDVHAEYSFV
jgi:cytochrome b